MVLDQLSVPGRPALDNRRARVYCNCSRCGWEFVGHFVSLVCHFSLLSPSFWEAA